MNLKFPYIKPFEVYHQMQCVQIGKWVRVNFQNSFFFFLFSEFVFRLNAIPSFCVELLTIRIIERYKYRYDLSVRKISILFSSIMVQICAFVRWNISSSNHTLQKRATKFVFQSTQKFFCVTSGKWIRKLGKYYFLPVKVIDKLIICGSCIALPIPLILRHSYCLIYLFRCQFIPTIFILYSLAILCNFHKTKKKLWKIELYSP